MVKVFSPMVSPPSDVDLGPVPFRRIRAFSESKGASRVMSPLSLLPLGLEA